MRSVVRTDVRSLSAPAAGGARSFATAHNFGGVAGAASPCGRGAARLQAGCQGKAFPFNPKHVEDLKSKRKKCASKSH